MQKYDFLAKKLKTEGLCREEFLGLLQGFGGLFDLPEVQYQLLKASGLPLIESEGRVFLATALTDYRDQIYCIVDIETNGSKPQHSQIIEIGAVKYQNGKILDTFESYIHSGDVPDYITKLTGISLEDLENAPGLHEALVAFRLFLGDCVFVAHNVEFDYSFISESLKRVGLGELANRKLCTIDLAKRTIQSERYGLGHLNTFLGINTLISHRAHADALTATKVFEYAVRNIPDYVKTTEDLITFSKSSKKQLKKAKELPQKEGELFLSKD